MKSLIFFAVTAFYFYIKPQLLYAQEDKETLEQQIERTKQIIVMITADVNDAQTVGAGIIVGREKDELFIVTAYHFLHLGEIPANKISVEFRDKQNKYFDATIVNHGNEEQMDWALLSVKNLSKQGFDVCSIKFDRLGDIKNVRRGTEVFALGNPNGMKWAIPVIPDRITDIEGDDIVFQSNFVKGGNSGGALLDRNAQIVGMILKDKPPFTIAINIDSLLDKVPLHSLLYPASWTAYSPSPLHVVANTGDLKLLRYFLDDNCNNVNTREAHGWTPLHVTAGVSAPPDAYYFIQAKYSPDATKILLNAGADVNALDNTKRSPLDYASQNGLIETAKILIKAGADLNGAGERVRPLSVAVEHKNPEMVKLLIKEGANVNLKFYGETPLHAAIGYYEYKTTEIIENLIKAGADVNAKSDVKSEEGETPLHKANYNSTVEIVKILIKAGAKVNAKDNKGNTPLHIAILKLWSGVEKDFYDRLEALLDAGADLKIKNSEGKTPLECAAQRWGTGSYQYHNITVTFAKYNH